MAAAKNSYWRPHIDGLRAISVLAVVLFHTDPDIVPGGFIGVDIFFVISGFLISRIIYDDIATHGAFRIIRFYERRARRILPTFFVVTATTIIAGYFLFLPAEFAALGRAAVAACGFAANIFFYRTIGYFGGQAITQPLLHYWSLGVEEQFYIGFPLIVLLISKLSRRLIAPAVFCAGIASFALAEIYLKIDPNAAFYLALPRAWELMVGALLALPDFPFPERRLPREIVAGAGLTLIVFGAATFTYATPFPGAAAAIPVIGAAAILWACESGRTLVGVSLSIAPLRQIGLWSYSIYMIHWPVIVFAHAIWPLGGAHEDEIIVFLSLALGAASYLLVETPFRKPRQLLNPPWLFGVSFTSLVALSAMALAVALSNGFSARLPQRVRQILAYNDYDENTVYRHGTCFLAGNQQWSDLKSDCLPSGRPSALLWGDSLAAHYYAALQDRFPGVTILQANMAACAPIVGFERFDVPHCRDFNDHVLAWALKNKPDTIILSAAWPLEADTLSKLDATLHSLRSVDLPVIVMGQTPIYLDTVPNILARRELRGDGDTLAQNEGTGRPFWADRAMKQRDSGIEGVKYISSRDTFCKDRDCPLMTDAGIPVNWDYSHLTRAGADLVLKHMLPKSTFASK